MTEILIKKFTRQCAMAVKENPALCRLIFSIGEKQHESLRLSFVSFSANLIRCINVKLW